MYSVGTGTVDLCTRRVFEAIQSSELQSRHIRWPTEAEREEAKQQIEQKYRLPEWRHGWCIVDGTLVPLFQKPTFYGEAFFDRKSNYSMNVQIINTPNGQIIDFASGFRGSRNDRHCFKFTRLWNDHEVLLNEGEWCWADSGYYLYDWLILPFRSPENTTRRNRTFNFHLSQLRIGSEHAIGYLKGRFQSLKELRVLIKSEEDIAFATVWINTCIIIHAFCLDQEVNFIDQEWLEDGYTFEQGLRANNDIQEPENESTKAREQTLANRRAKREELKAVLMRNIDKIA